MTDMKCIYCGHNNLESCYAAMGAKDEASYAGKTEYYQCAHCHAFVAPQEVAELNNPANPNSVITYTIPAVGRSLGELIEQGQEYMDDKRWLDGIRLWDTAIAEYGSDPLLIVYRSCCLAMYLTSAQFDDDVYAAICVVKHNANFLLNGLREEEIEPRHHPREVVYYLQRVSTHYLEVTHKYKKATSANATDGEAAFLQRPQVLDKVRHTLRDIAVAAKAIQALYAPSPDDDEVDHAAQAAEKLQEHLRQQLDQITLLPRKKSPSKKIAIVILALLVIILAAGIVV